MGVGAADQNQIRRALRLLMQEGLIEADEIRTHTSWGMFIKGVTANGLRELGQWPRASENDVAALVSALDRLSERLQHENPEAAGKLKEFGRFLGAHTADVGFELLKEWVKLKLRLSAGA